MQKVIKEQIGKHEFRIIADMEALLAKVQAFPKYEKETFVPFEGDCEDYWSEEEFEKNKEDFIAKIKEACTDKAMQDAAHILPKKKNGTFYKNRKDVVMHYENTLFFTEWHNTWATFELRYSALNDLEAELQIVEYNHTPA